MHKLTNSQEQLLEIPCEPNTTITVTGGAGTGKTYSLAYKVYDLINSGTISPDEVLILSLTNSAINGFAAELIRIFEKSDLRYTSTESSKVETVEKIDLHTFHEICYKILSEAMPVVNATDLDESNGLASLLLNKKAITQEETYRLCERLNVLTIDRIIEEAHKLIKNTAYLKYDVRRRIDSLLKKYKVIVIENYQDLYPLVSSIVSLIAVDKQLILSGDPGQKIYGFLGNNNRALAQVYGSRSGKTYSIELNTNLRNTPEIIAKARSINKNAAVANYNVLKPACLVEPFVANYSTELDAMEFLLDQICRLICCSSKSRDIAILTSTNSQLKTVQEYLKQYGISTRNLKLSASRLYDSETTLFINTLKVARIVMPPSIIRNDSPTGETGDFNIIKAFSMIKGIGKSAIRKLLDLSNVQGISLWSIIISKPSTYELPKASKAIMSKYAKAINSLVHEKHIQTLKDPELLFNEVMETLSKFGVHLKTNIESFDDQALKSDQFIQTIKAFRSTRGLDTSAIDWILKGVGDGSFRYDRFRIQERRGLENSIKLSTMHAATGFESPIVFLLGQNTSFNIDDKLLYVGMTRSRNLLYLTNIMHPSLNRTKNYPDLLDKASYWKYYSKDLNRDALKDYSVARVRYNKLSKHIWCNMKSYSTANYLFKIMKKFL
ncbi:HBL386Wp [Eremothecium sinecaudum]|uniref:DNA 3'-5' helicase n=1 Tax=Eremothecium sinecaudum TaxID=45286 RepID=A0A125RDT1_9SACH|nr:HBL386Wp [Eremothecium sinecaudum]AMD18516.1 HBL386Wp [Eremothecium sinecaudum]